MPIDDRLVLMNEPMVALADVVDGSVLVRWEGGTVELHPLWLRERSTTAGAIDPANRQRLFEPSDLPTDLAVVHVDVVDGSDLSVTFSDDHRMALPLNSLLAFDAERPPSPTPWIAGDIDVPIIDYRALAGDDEPSATAARRQALTAFFELGFFVLQGTPPVPGALHEITSHFGRISPTNFGTLFDVRTEPLAVDLAYTPVALSAHTDQPYRAPSPGLQFLHTIANDAPGGASTMVDGLAAVTDLAAADPEAHEVLCSLPVEFRYDIGSDVKVHRAPLIERHLDGSLRQFRFSPRLDFAPLTDRRTLEVYYRGRRWLAGALNDPTRQLEYRMQAGDTLVVDNHRVLHGRTSFDPTRGYRHLQGCYIDHDGPVTAWILAQRTSWPNEHPGPTNRESSTMTNHDAKQVVSFTEMQHGTAEDYLLLDRLERIEVAGLADNLIDTLRGLEESLDGYQITRLEHSLQTATRARRAGADVDWIVAALLHDLGDQLAPYNHAEYAASVLRPYVREEVTWVVQQHGVFQSYYYAHHLGRDRNGRDAFADHPWYQVCADFCAQWDQSSFDPEGPMDSLDSFVDEIREVFARPAWDPAVMAAGSGSLVP